MQNLSVIIIAQDEEEDIAACLESIKWADEIIVVDAFSKDRTVEICRRYTEKVFQKEWPGYASQKRYALEKASNPWVLSIDADERVSPELRDEMRGILSSIDENGSGIHDEVCEGYKIPRLSTFLGKVIRHGGWYPSYQLRLFRRDKTTLSNSRVHEGFIVDGIIGFLKSDLIHFTHKSLSESLARMNRYSSLEALDRFERNPRKIRLYHFFTHPLAAFTRQFIIKKGFLDGAHGLILAMVTAMVKLALYLKIWELQNKQN